MKTAIKSVIVLIMACALVFSVLFSYNMITKGQSTDVSVSAMVIKQLPEKLEYWEGEKFDPTGLELVAFYDDGSEKNLKSGYLLALKLTLRQVITPSSLPLSSLMTVRVNLCIWTTEQPLFNNILEL